MKKIFGTILLSVLTLSAVNAQTISADIVKTDVAKVLNQTYYNTIANDFDVEINISNSPFRDLLLPDGEITYKVSSPEGRFMPRDIKRLDVFVNGNYVKTICLPVEMKAYKYVLTTTCFVDRNQSITSNNTALKRVDVANMINYFLTTENLSKEITTKKALKAGEVLDKRFLKIKPDVERNTEVRVFFSTNDSLMITVDAIALEDGSVGDWVSVENKKYNKVYKGKIIGENKVLVAI